MTRVGGKTADLLCIKGILSLFLVSVILVSGAQADPTRDKPSESSARTQLQRSVRYLSENCQSNFNRSPCIQSLAAAMYIYHMFKDYNSARDLYKKYPKMVDSDYHNCSTYHWGMNNNYFTVSVWFSNFIINKKTNWDPSLLKKQYIYAYMCEAFGMTTALGPAPNDEYPVGTEQFVAMAKKYLDAKSAAELERFDREIAKPRRDAWMKIASGGYNSKRLALTVELDKNALSASDARGFGESYTDTIKQFIDDDRYRLKINERVNR